MNIYYAKHMAATTVRLDTDTKALLDRLQAELTLKRGEKLSHSDVLAKLLEFVRAREKQFLDEAAWKPLTPVQIERLSKIGFDWGVETSSEDIDEVLYGGDRP